MEGREADSFSHSPEPTRFVANEDNVKNSEKELEQLCH